MRRDSVLIVAIVLAALLAVAAPPASAAEVTRSLTAEIPAGSAWAVENLAGIMTVVPGTGSTATVVTATVHAESDELADLIKIEQVAGAKGVPTLRVRYPVGNHQTYRYPKINGKGSSSMSSWFSGGTQFDYDGQRVKVSGSGGALLYVDLEVQVPAKAAAGSLINHVGHVAARGVQGELGFEAANGDVALDQSGGSLKVTTGSGDVQATDGTGTLAIETGSGDVKVEEFSGEQLRCEVGSGDVTLHAGAIRKVIVETGSGDVNVEALDAEEFNSETGSGDIAFEAAGTRLLKVKTETGSGDVTLMLGADASFEAHADQGSGSLVNRYPDATPIAKGREVIGYKRGDGRIQIRVDTGSGDLVIEPEKNSKKV
jgi:hypothetical protein